MSISSLKIEADGVDIELSGETAFKDVHLKVNRHEPIILSPRNAIILGLALIEMAEGEEE